MPDHTEVESHVLPGIYAAMLAEDQKAAAEPDPRLFLVDDEASRQRQIEKERAELAAHPERRRRKTVLDIDAPEHGESVLIPKWLLGGHSWPQARQWKEFRDPEVRMYRMFPDDHLEPVRGVESEFASPADLAPNRAARREMKRRFNL